VEKLIKRSIKTVFDSYFPSLDALADVIKSFEHGYVEVADVMPSEDYIMGVREIKGLQGCIDTLGISESPAEIAAAVEFTLEGLHLNNKLNKEDVRGKIIYK
jgi:magnesium chelatase subunit I